MMFRLVLLVSIVTISIQCSNETESTYAEMVVEAYDTLELRYQQLGDLAMELVSNVSVDPQVRTAKVPDLLERQPVVSIDFRKPLTTRKDIVEFVKYQEKIDGEVQGIFKQLSAIPKWQSAPLVLEYRSRYDSLKDNVSLAIGHFNAVVKEAKLNLAIPEEAVQPR